MSIRTATANDVSSDDEIQSPKTPGDWNEKFVTESMQWANSRFGSVSPATADIVSPKTPGGDGPSMSAKPLTWAESVFSSVTPPLSPVAGSSAAGSRAPGASPSPGPRYSSVSPCSYRPFDPADDEEDRARQREEDRREALAAKKAKAELLTPQKQAEQKQDYAKLVPLFEAAELELPAINAANWWSYNRTLKRKIEEEQQELYRLQRLLSARMKAYDKAQMFEFNYHK